MADRIFPNNTQTSMGSKIEFQGINWDEVASSMKSNRFAEDKTQAVLDLLLKAGIELSPNQEGEISDIVNQFSGDSDHDMGHDHEDYKHKELSPDFQKTPDLSDEKPGFSLGDGDGDADDDFMTMKVSKKNNMRKIAFTHPSQISAEAIEKALASGDKRLANTILAARKENRLKIASRIQQQAQQAIRKAQAGGEADLGGLASGNATEPAMPPQGGAGGDQSDSAYQNGFNAGQSASEGMPTDNKGYSGAELYKYMEGFFAAQAQKGEGDMSGGMPGAGGADSTGADLAPTTAFTSPNKFTQAQRASFKKIAVSLGFPKEYVDAMCGQTPRQLPQDVEALNQKIKEVYSSSISKNTKTSLIKSLVKEAKLAPDSKSEFIRFWNELLGYQDKAFWPQVAEDYTETK